MSTVTVEPLEAAVALRLIRRDRRECLFLRAMNLMEMASGRTERRWTQGGSERAGGGRIDDGMGQSGGLTGSGSPGGARNEVRMQRHAQTHVAMVKMTMTANETVQAMMTGSSKLSRVELSHPLGSWVGRASSDWRAGEVVEVAAGVNVPVELTVSSS